MTIKKKKGKVQSSLGFLSVGKMTIQERLCSVFVSSSVVPKQSLIRAESFMFVNKYTMLLCTLITIYFLLWLFSQILLVSNGGKFMKKTLIGEAYIWLDKVDLRKRIVNWHKLLVSSTQAHWAELSAWGTKPSVSAINSITPRLQFDIIVFS